MEVGVGREMGVGCVGCLGIFVGLLLNVGVSVNLSLVFFGCGFIGEVGGSFEGKFSCNKSAGERLRIFGVYLRFFGRISFRRFVLGGFGVVGG